MVKIILKKMEAGKFILPCIKVYYKDTVAKIVWCWYKD